MKTTIRLKLVLSILPVLIASFAVAGVSSILLARAGMIRLAMRNLAFKAETLKQYGEAQWGLVVSQGFDTDPEFVAAARSSFARQAETLLREDTECFLALDLDGALAMYEGRAAAPAEVPPALAELMRNGMTGAVRFTVEDGERFGQAFYFSPFGWYVVASDLASSIFAETQRISIALVAALGVSVAVAFAMLLVLSRSIARPIAKLAASMGSIMETNDFSACVEAESGDEVGLLTLRFTELCHEIDRSYRRIGEIATREVEARVEIVERDIEALLALGKVSEYRDEETSNHTLRVGLYADAVGARFFPEEEERRVLVYAAPMHDLGKIGVPDSILLKPAKLTGEEFERMKLHTVIGHAILKEFRSPFLVKAAEISLSHHERWDGKGYPNGLSGEAIPLSGRILAVLDVFDALVSERPYKPAWPLEKAFGLIGSERGSHFDPAVVDAFMDARERIVRILEANQK
ncbi:MAG: HD domain-containing protein [Spirochaetales bacterium]|nr:HD domain-containing protein [Spirochaetales bacterium]